jgi:dihydrofolate reductase
MMRACQKILTRRQTEANANLLSGSEQASGNATNWCRPNDSQRHWRTAISSWIHLIVVLQWRGFTVAGLFFEDHAPQSEAKMRKVIFAINVSLDGCCDHTVTIADEELLEHYADLLRDVDVQVFGRKTYELMVPYWPDAAKDPSETKASREFAKAFVSTKKIVFSRSLASAESENTRIVRTGLRDEMLRLKQEHGKNILVGGVDIPSQLIELGLVDEIHFVVQPIIAGAGRRLLEGVSLQEKLRLKLVESKILKSGCVALHYSKRSQNN